MLLRAPVLEDDIITLPSHPAEIRNIIFREESDVIFYRVTVMLDIDAVIQNNSYNLNAFVYKKKPDENLAERKVTSPRRWKRKTKRLEKKVRRNAKKRREQIIARTRVDLSKYISNDLANAKSTNLTRQQLNSISALSTVVKPLDPFTQNVKASIVAPTPGVNPFKKKKISKSSKENSLSTTVNQVPSSKVPSSPKFSKSILKSKKDPASINSSSLVSLKTLSKPLQSMASSFVFTPPTALQALPIVRVSPRKKKVDFVLRISRNRLVDASSFFLKLELENKRGVKVDEASCVIPHARILNTFITPNVAPKLEAEYIKPGAISVRILPPRDRMAKTLKVFRRLTAPVEGGTDSGSAWSIVYNSPIEDRAEVVFKDEVNTSRPVLYRAVAYGENSKPSEKFASTVVLPLKQFAVKQTGALTAVPRMTTSGSNTFARVMVKDIPDDVVTVMLRRYDLTTASDAKRKASTGSGFTYVGSTPDLQTLGVEQLGPDSSVSFTDLATKTGRTYSFVPVGVTKTGREIVGSSAILEIPISPSREKVRMSVTAPKVVSAEPASAELSFELSATFTEFGFSEVRSVLESGGQKSLFDNNLIQDRDKFESLISFLVERRNSKTGEEESFGVVQAGEFSDSPEKREEKNVKPPEPGTEYTYTFTALVASAESLFPTLTRSDVDIRTLQSFSRKVSKFQNPLSLSRATLQSTQRQQDKSRPSRLEPSDPVVAGRTDIQVVHEIRFPLPSRDDNTLRIENYKSFNRLVWKTSQASTIDHFKIYVVSSGGRVLIDTVHCDDSTSEFYYRHYSKDYAVNYKYVIQPINLAYEELSPIYSRSIKAFSALKTLSLSSFTKIKRL